MEDLEHSQCVATKLGTKAPEDLHGFGEDPITQEPLFQTPDLPEREGLYSTPLSWTRPVLETPSYNTTLSREEETKLRIIAMPHLASQHPLSPSLTSSPESEHENDNRRKRKTSIDDDDDEEEISIPDNGRRVKKTAHNMIEKRYRTNLNDKIAALRDSVPSLRSMNKASSGDSEEVKEDLQGLTPAHRLNKATVLSKATEYIAHLEKCNKSLTKDITTFKSRIAAFEILVMSGQASSPNMNS